jgi:mannose-6-phosphate isomerase-like protein (cupin superfamily)
MKAILACTDLDAAIAFYETLGFRLDLIMPADAPRRAELSGHGVTLELGTGEAAPALGAEPAFIASQSGGAWSTGRAGMLYRDLVPGRLGGRVIASHIRIPDGGPVNDYVHYHHIAFQMIYCRRGWVRVVYEDQGAPFVMAEGDCVLQPPGIRHRVLESSPGLEVIEVSAPAEHETRRDHVLALPTAVQHRERIYGGQRFVRHIAAHASWHREGALETRDLGIAAATSGRADARVVRAREAADIELCDRRHQVLTVLEGEAEIGIAPDRRHRLETGEACAIPGDLAAMLSVAPGCEILAVALPV